MLLGLACLQPVLPYVKNAGRILTALIPSHYRYSEGRDLLGWECPDGQCRFRRAQGWTEILHGQARNESGKFDPRAIWARPPSPYTYVEAVTRTDAIHITSIYFQSQSYSIDMAPSGAEKYRLLKENHDERYSDELSSHESLAHAHSKPPRKLSDRSVAIGGCLLAASLVANAVLGTTIWMKPHRATTSTTCASPIGKPILQTDYPARIVRTTLTCTPSSSTGKYTPAHVARPYHILPAQHDRGRPGLGQHGH